MCRAGLSCTVPGVCVRLRDEIERRFAEQMAARRAEEAEAARKAEQEKQQRTVPELPAPQRRSLRAVPTPALALAPAPAALGGGGASGHGAQWQQPQRPAAAPGLVTRLFPSWPPSSPPWAAPAPAPVFPRWPTSNFQVPAGVLMPVPTPALPVHGGGEAPSEGRNQLRRPQSEQPALETGAGGGASRGGAQWQQPQQPPAAPALATRAFPSWPPSNPPWVVQLAPQRPTASGTVPCFAGPPSTQQQGQATSQGESQVVSRQHCLLASQGTPGWLPLVVLEASALLVCRLARRGALSASSAGVDGRPTDGGFSLWFWPARIAIPVEDSGAGSAESQRRQS